MIDGLFLAQYPLLAKVLIASLALILTAVLVLAVTVVRAFFLLVYLLLDKHWHGKQFGHSFLLRF